MLSEAVEPRWLPIFHDMSKGKLVWDMFILALAVLTSFVENDETIYRFGHLTFQEHLCSNVLSRLAAEESGMDRVKNIMVASGGIKLGPHVGQGTVRFSTAEDARRALINLNHSYMGNRYIELFYAS